MGNINKGTIASISGNTARVVPSDAGAKPTAKITIPWHLRGSTGNLSKGTAVVYVEFDDSTGLLLGRADGEWGCYLPSLSAGNISVSIRLHSRRNDNLRNISAARNTRRRRKASGCSRA